MPSFSMIRARWFSTVFGLTWIRSAISRFVSPEAAPWLICIFGSRRSVGAGGKLRKNYYVAESVGIATGFLIAALHEAGLATLTHTPNPMGFLNEICGRPDSDKPYILLVTGYPAEGATIPLHATYKKPLEEIASFL